MSDPEEEETKGSKVLGTPDFHWPAFCDFIRWDTRAGGPDPHMQIVVHVAQTELLGDKIKAWYLGLYAAAYNAPTADVLLHFWPSPHLVLADEAKFTEWVKDNWKRFSFRRERRAVRTPRKFAINLIALAHWVMEDFAKMPNDTVDNAYECVKKIQYNGRYNSLKFYEALRRAMPHRNLPVFRDIQPRGGWSPRQMLSWLYPEHDGALNGNDKPAHLEIANRLAEETKKRLLTENIELDWFVFEVMLCDYKQSYLGGQYPGRAQDSELGHVAHVVANNPDVPIRTLEVRKKLFPHEVLGELNGWEGRRKELGLVLTQHGYTWSDFKFDYMATKDLAHPVKKVPPPAPITHVRTWFP